MIVLMDLMKLNIFGCIYLYCIRCNFRVEIFSFHHFFGRRAHARTLHGDHMAAKFESSHRAAAGRRAGQRLATIAAWRQATHKTPNKRAPTIGNFCCLRLLVADPLAPPPSPPRLLPIFRLFRLLPLLPRVPPEGLCVCVVCVRATSKFLPYHSHNRKYFNRGRWRGAVVLAVAVSLSFSVSFCRSPALSTASTSTRSSLSCCCERLFRPVNGEGGGDGGSFGQ